MALGMMAIGTSAALASPKPFNIASEDARRSLLEFGRQSQVQILFATEEVKGVITNAVQGTYEPLDALHLLLNGTTLVAGVKADGVLVVEPSKGHGASDADPSPAADSGKPQLAQAGEARSPSTGDATATDSKSRAADSAGIEEIIVTATRRLERLQDVPVSVMAFSQEKIDAEDGWEMDRRIDIALDALRCPPADALVTTLSGGERRRVALCRLLLEKPDLLLLDEPTNHLDIDAITWLEKLMSEFAGALLFVSHDRAFIRALATRIVDLDRGQLREWSGNYDSYVLEKRAALDVESKHAALFDKRLAQEEVWIRQGVEARRTRNEGRVRALKQLRIERRERREALDQMACEAEEPGFCDKVLLPGE